MLPAPGVTGGEPFTSGTLEQKKAWLGLLYKMMQRARITANSIANATTVDNALVAAGLPADSLTEKFAFADQELQAVMDRLEAILKVLWKFPVTHSPLGVENTAPTSSQAAEITSLMSEVKSCYTDIVEGKADQQIEKYFGVKKTDKNAGKVRELFQLGADAAGNLIKVLQDDKPPSNAPGLRVLIDISGELAMKNAAALGSTRGVIVEPSYADSTTGPANQAVAVNTLLHECMHVASAKITDPMYWPNVKFFEADFKVRINNADHFARAAIEYRQTKTPSPGGGGPSPGDGLFKNIHSEKDRDVIGGALGTAQDLVRTAWIYCLDAWDALKNLYGDSKYYGHLGLFDKPKLQRSLKLISQISQATLHDRSNAPDRWLPSVTAFDLAALEEVIMDLAGLIHFTRTRSEIQVVANYPDTAAKGVLYVTEALLKARDIRKLADSFLWHGFSRFDQTGLWLRLNGLIADIGSMVSDKNSFRSLPVKPKNA